MLNEFIHLIPDSLLHEPGRAFNSGRLAFSAPSSIYVLLLNPAYVDGDPQATVSQQAREVAKRKPENWCAFLDDQWGNRPPGKHFLQRNLLQLYARLGVSPRKAPSSQLVFLATKTPADLKKRSDFQDLLEDCWQFHAAVIQTLQPRAIVCVGKDAAYFARRKLNAGALVGEHCADVGKRPRTSQSHKNAQGLTVISLPHPAAPGFGPDWTYEEIDLVAHAVKRPVRSSDFNPIRIGGEMISDTVIAGRGRY